MVKEIEKELLEMSKKHDLDIILENPEQDPQTILLLPRYKWYKRKTLTDW